MATNLLSGIDQETLEKWLREAQEALAGGASIISVSSGDTSTSVKVEIPIKERIYHLLKALNQLDPDNYPDSMILRRVRTPIYFR